MRRPGTITYPKTVGPWELEPHYSHHVGAMTAEALHSKADIAFQLALRDKELELLRKEFLAATARDEIKAQLSQATAEMATLRACVEAANDYINKRSIVPYRQQQQLVAFDAAMAKLKESQKP